MLAIYNTCKTLNVPSSTHLQIRLVLSYWPHIAAQAKKAAVRHPRKKEKKIWSAKELLLADLIFLLIKIEDLLSFSQELNLINSSSRFVRDLCEDLISVRSTIWRIYDFATGIRYFVGSKILPDKKSRKVIWSRLSPDCRSPSIAYLPEVEPLSN